MSVGEMYIHSIRILKVRINGKLAEVEDWTQVYISLHI